MQFYQTHTFNFIEKSKIDFLLFVLKTFVVEHTFPKVWFSLFTVLLLSQEQCANQCKGIYLKPIYFKQPQQYLVFVPSLGDKFVSNFNFWFQQVSVEIVTVNLKELGHSFALLENEIKRLECLLMQNFDLRKNPENFCFIRLKIRAVLV